MFKFKINISPVVKLCYAARLQGPVVHIVFAMCFYIVWDVYNLAFGQSPIEVMILFDTVKLIAPSPHLHLFYRPEPDAELSISRTAAPGGGRHLRVLRGADQPVSSAWRAWVWERSEEHLHHGPDGGAEQTEGATRQQQAPAPGQGPEPAGWRHKYKLYRRDREDGGYACQGEKQKHDVLE